MSLAFLAVAALPALAQNQLWIRQLGTSADEYAYAAAPDGSAGVYLCGPTRGSVGGPNAGVEDAWLAHFDSAGNSTWIRQFGTSTQDRARAAAPDGSGGVYVCGWTEGNLAATNAGGWDAWVARYDSAGNQTWIRQIGTYLADLAIAVAPDGTGGVFVGGATEGDLGGPNPSSGEQDVWLARYDGAGNQVWIRQFGEIGHDHADAAASDGLGGVLVAGITMGSLGGPHAGGEYDAWVARYDSAGIRTWIRQLGTNTNDGARTVASDGCGGVYASGETYGSLSGPSAGAYDAWLAHYDGAGGQTWIRQFGTSTWDEANAAVPDGAGGVYVSGYSDGSLGGPAAGHEDAWLARYDSVGNRVWIRQIGSSAADIAWAAAPDGSGGLYVGGATGGSLGGPNPGGWDVWLARYDGSCSASTSYCTAGTTTNGCVPSMAYTGCASASAGSGFTISISGVEGAQSGLIFYGLSGAVANPWGTSASFMCVKAPFERMPIQSSGGTPGACDGALSFDWNLYVATHPSALGSPFAGGEIVNAQGWFRDPPSPKTTNLSNGLQFSVCP